MKIQQIKVNFVRLPPEEPLVGAPYMTGMMCEFFTVQVQTDQGIEGIGSGAVEGRLVGLKAARQQGSKKMERDLSAEEHRTFRASGIFRIRKN